MKPTLLIVDDCAAARSTLRSLVEDEFQVVGEAKDGWEAVQRCRELSPSVVVMDAAMPKMSGIDATRLILESLPRPPRIVMVSGLDDEQVALRAFEAGAVDWCVKPVSKSTLCDVLRGFVKKAA